MVKPEELTSERNTAEIVRREYVRRRLESNRWIAAIEPMVLELITVLTHKLKSPLTGLSLVASRLRRTSDRGGGDPALRTLADQIDSMTGRLSTEVDRILEPLVGACPTLVPMDVQQVAEDAVLLAMEEAGREDLEITLTAGKAVPPARGDVDFLLRALHDLLVNAGRIAAPPSKIEVSTSMVETGEVEIGVTINTLPPGRAVETLLRPPETQPEFPLLVVPRILQRIGGQVRSFPVSADVVRVCFHLPAGTGGSLSSGAGGSACRT